ncbi:pirin-like bicupin family protein [Kribbella albertanoniae]|uniref:Pirin family protein n=1 Tax=Kribbella albertanoniae TaxID=1266829 RepID=A0A4R4PJJ5_9ACTN|nr:pirin-like bicupin family protein [Kribbella albertanoniae]TDC22241.1 pirin family protein [Kribbella albertanoniae]
MAIWRADERFVTAESWLESRHSFSFGPFYDPANIGFGFLVAHNDDVVAPGKGFETHPHQDLEIVTWVLRGALAHRDSEGHSGVVHPGLVQRMTAGSGIRHSEWNDGPDPVHYVQMWVRPDRFDLTPSYAQSPFDLTTGELVPVVSGLPHHTSSMAIRLHQQSAGLLVARLGPDQHVQLPEAPYLHVFVAEGTATLEGVGTLATADAARLTNSDGRQLTAGPTGAEALIWEMH